MATAYRQIRTALFGTTLTLGLFAGLLSTTAAQQSSPPRPAPASPPQTEPAPPAPSEPMEEQESAPIQPITLTEALLQEIEALNVELADTRAELAQARLDAQSAQRELNELRQFVLDHERFGSDFQQYKAVKDIAERETRARMMEQARAQRDADKAQRDVKRAAARSQAQQQNAEANRIARYRGLGFTPLGLDVYTSKMAFFYNTKDVGGGTRVDYDTLIGSYLRPFPPITEIDYSKMTISGSVLNASSEVRNLGVAVTFFDENGNQVGHETVQIKNARPDVPYPFTSKIDMALNRPFASSSTYVLYADATE